MRQLQLFIDDAQAGCGFRVVLEVSQGRQWAHLLHVPSLTHIKIEVRELEDQLRRGVARELPIRRGAIGAIEAKRRQLNSYNFRLPGNLIDEALAGLRSQRREEP